MSLGALVNAALRRDSHPAHGWTHALEQAKADNPASVGMIIRCGLHNRDGLMTVLINIIGGYLIR
jgi:hypothetical protein